jgi:hypothetical protein
MRRWAWGACALALTLCAASALEDAASSGVHLAVELEARCPPPRGCSTACCRAAALPRCVKAGASRSRPR